MKKNDDIKLIIENLSSLGSGVGHINGFAVFVANTAVGDEIIAHIIKVKKTYAIGVIKEIIKPSKSRIEVTCSVFSRCGGCAYRHISYLSECEAKYNKVKDCLERIGHIDIVPEPIIKAKNTDRYRNKAEYPVSLNKDGNISIGFYSQKSHRVVNCDDCLLQPEGFQPIIEAIRRWALTNKISIYNEETGKGLLRHIYIREGIKTGEKMVCLVINGKSVSASGSLITSILKADSKVKTIVLNENTQKTNVILGVRYESIFGDGHITDILCGKKIRLSPLSFYQVNHEQAEKLYEKAREYADLTGEEVLLDLYCGVGTIGISMVDYVKKLIGVEIIPQAIEDAKINAKINGIDNAEFYANDAKETAKMLLERGILPDVVVLDPPRKGCDYNVLKTVSEMSPKRIVYVSCDPSTLARDLNVLQGLGYETQKVTPADLFPRTVHVESVVLLSRA